MESNQTRRKFITSTLATSAALSLQSVSKNKKLYSSETLVTQLYKSLTQKQKSEICFDFDHKLRLAVDNN